MFPLLMPSIPSSSIKGPMSRSQWSGKYRNEGRRDLYSCHISREVKELSFRYLALECDIRISGYELARDKYSLRVDPLRVGVEPTIEQRWEIISTT